MRPSLAHGCSRFHCPYCYHLCLFRGLIQKCCNWHFILTYIEHSKCTQQPVSTIFILSVNHSQPHGWFSLASWMVVHQLLTWGLQSKEIFERKVWLKIRRVFFSRGQINKGGKGPENSAQLKCKNVVCWETYFKAKPLGIKLTNITDVDEKQTSLTFSCYLNKTLQSKMLLTRTYSPNHSSIAHYGNLCNIQKFFKLISAVW